MKKNPFLLVVGVVVALLGLMFTLQGFDVLSGTGGMYGSATWKVLGPVILLVGVVVAVRGRGTPSR